MQDQLNNFPELKSVYESLNERYGNCITGFAFDKGELSFKVRKEYILPVLKFLKHDLGFNALNDMIALDNMAKVSEGSKRFSILYQLYRFKDFQRVRVSIDLDDGEKAESIYSVYKSSDWAEREIFDMFGITFSGHPDLKRIYMWDDFSGFPLRKDFPLEG